MSCPDGIVASITGGVSEMVGSIGCVVVDWYLVKRIFYCCFGFSGG